MATTVTSRESARYADYASELESRGAGWIVYAAIMLGLAGTFNTIDGLLAVFRSKVYTPNATYVFSDLRTWGWIILALGILELCAALAVLNGSQVARWFGIAVAGVNAIGQLMFVHAYPFWSLSMFAADMLVIYALAVYGGRAVEAEA